MADDPTRPRFYDGDGDRLVANLDQPDRVTLWPDGDPLRRPAEGPKVRLMWGQNLLEDLLAGRYRTLVCGVNAHDNSHGIIAQLATLLPTSQWSQPSITSHAARFVQGGTVSVIKFDMDAVEVLGLLRPGRHDAFTLDDLSVGFKIVAEMIHRRPQRRPSASVSFLGARANRVLDAQGREPAMESVLRVMHEAGYAGDVYPAPTFWQLSGTPVFARYPFPTSVARMREGGF